MRQLSITFLLTFFFLKNISAEKIWVSFRDKSEVTFDPYNYFSERTIVQRIEQRLPLCDSLDFPVSDKYLTTLSHFSDSMSYSSRWLNGVAVFCSVQKAEEILKLPFVKSIEALGSKSFLAEKKMDLYQLNKYDQRLIAYQTERLGAQQFTNKQLDGTGIRIAVLDAGFSGVDQNYVFTKTRNENKIIATYDFVKKVTNVYEGNAHGTGTLSCIVGKADTVLIGLATGAEILLARTERVSSEKFSEEENWLAAVEWADKNGANIISSSLGYSNARYFNFDMTGKKSLIASAATIAAQKGILVINAAGNDGENDWHFVSTPGDADSVLTVGGTDPETDYHSRFSSYGPTADGRMKPNVVAPAHVICAAKTGLTSSYGTSFSAPLVAGFAACVWQAHRNWTNMQVFRAIEKSGNLYPYFDYAHGYGIPQALYFVSDSITRQPTFDFVIVNNEMKVILREKYAHSAQEKELGFEARRNFYIKIENGSGKLKNYSVLLADKKEMSDFDLYDLAPGDIVTVHFEGYTKSYTRPNELQ